jgi:hypothetical protein
VNDLQGNGFREKIGRLWWRDIHAGLHAISDFLIRFHGFTVNANVSGANQRLDAGTRERIQSLFQPDVKPEAGIIFGSREMVVSGQMFVTSCWEWFMAWMSIAYALRFMFYSPAVFATRRKGLLRRRSGSG